MALLARIKRMLNCEEGTAATEYAVMLALIVLVCLVAIVLLGEGVRDVFSGASTDLPDGTPS